MKANLALLLLPLIGLCGLAKANDFGFKHFEIATKPIPIKYHVLSSDGEFTSKKPVILAPRFEEYTNKFFQWLNQQ